MEKRKVKDIAEDVVSQVEESPAPENTQAPHSGEKRAEAEVYLTEFFVALIDETVGSLPYNTKLVSSIGRTITLNNFVTFIEQHVKNSMTIAELNLIIDFLYSLPFRNVRKLMNIAEKKEEQSKLWTIKNPE